MLVLVLPDMQLAGVHQSLLDGVLLVLTARHVLPASRHQYVSSLRDGFNNCLVVMMMMLRIAKTDSRKDHTYNVTIGPEMLKPKLAR